MSESPAGEKTSLRFESYNGMSRPALFIGFPILPFAGLFLGGLIAAGLGTALLSWVWGMVFVVPFVVVLVALRVVCLIDPQYMRRVRAGLRRYRYNLMHGRALLLTPCNPKWSQFYGKRFSQQRFSTAEKSPAAGLSRGRPHHDA